MVEDEEDNYDSPEEDSGQAFPSFDLPSFGGDDDDDSGGSDNSGSTNGDSSGKVKGGKDKARRGAKNAGEFLKNTGNFIKELITSKEKRIKAIIIIVVIGLAILLFWIASEKQESNDAVVTVDTYMAANKAGTKAETMYKTTGSLLYLNGEEIEEIEKKYLADIEDQNPIKYKALKKKYYNGDPDETLENGVASINRKDTIMFHIFNAEKYNFNKIKWQAYTRANLANNEEPTGELDMQIDEELGLRYPKYMGDQYAESDLDFYVDSTYRYLQSWIIPFAMISGTTSGGSNGHSEEEADATHADAYNTRFGYEIMASAYHDITYDRFELYTRTIDESYRAYDETVAKGKVVRTCTTYTKKFTDEEGNVTGIDTTTICNDSAPSYISEEKNRYIEYPKNIPNGYNNIKNYVANSHEEEKDSIVRTNSDNSLKVNDLGNESSYRYDITEYQGFDQKFKKEYQFVAYDIMGTEMLAEETAVDYNSEKVYESGTQTTYEPVVDVAPAWIYDDDVTKETTTTTVNVEKVIREGQTINVSRVWTDELILNSSESGNYTVDDIKEFVEIDEFPSEYEQNYYDGIISDYDGINKVDIINSKKEIYDKYLSKDGNRSKYIGYSRDYLKLSYEILKDLIINMSQNYGISFVWGNTVVPYLTTTTIGEGITGETLIVSGVDVIYPFSNEEISKGNLVLQDNYVGNGSYGYKNHTGIDISYNYSAADTSQCSDTPSRCPYVKGPKVYTILTGTLTEVTYSECNTYYSTGHCSDDAYIQSLRSKANSNLEIKTSSGATSVTILGADGTKTIYYHLYPDFDFFNELSKHIGETLPLGTLVGYMGNTGKSSGLHLHIENGTKLWEKNGSGTLKLLLQGRNNTTGHNISQVTNSSVMNNQIAYTGTMSQEFYYFLGVHLEGLDIDNNSYFEAYNLKDGTITIGPGVTNVGETDLAKKMGYGQYFPMKAGDKIPKSVIADIYYAALDAKYISVVEKYANNAGLKLKQNQVEALVCSAYQRGPYDDTFKKLFKLIKENSPELEATWTYSSGQYAEGKRNRRKAEYALFSTGEYRDKINYKLLNFTTKTAFSDALAGKDTVK